jgi:hypothetical protein
MKNPDSRHAKHAKRALAEGWKRGMKLDLEHWENALLKLTQIIDY